MRRRVTASCAASSTGPTWATWLPMAAASASSTAGWRSAWNASSSRRPNSSGSTLLTITPARNTSVSVRNRSASSMVSLTGISSGAETMTAAVMAGSLNMSTIHPVWSRTRPTLTSSLIACGAASWPITCPVAEASTTIRS